MKSVVRWMLCAALLGLVMVRPSRAAEPLKVGYSDWPGWVAFEVAIQKGFFKEAGVDVEFTWFEYGPSMEAFAAGKVDGLTVANGDAMVTGAPGKAMTAILLTDYSNGNDMIVARAGIDTFKDLKGKKIGLEQNLVEHLMLLKALEMNGMRESDVTIVNVPTNETPQALAAGGVDAIAAWYPIAGQALKQVAGSKAVFTSADVPGLIYDGLYVSKESLAKHPAEWKKVVSVWFRTVKFIQDPATRDEAIKIMAARVNVPAEEYGRSMMGTALLGEEGNAKRYAPGDGLDSVYGSSKVANEFNVKHGVYKDSQDVNAYLDASLVKP